MSQKSVEAVIELLLSDELFRQQAAHDLEEVCCQRGFSLSEAELKMVRNINLLDLSSLPHGLEGGIRRFSA